MAIRFLRARPATPRTAFVLGGGGNLGAMQVGMLRALLERDTQPDVVIGCSVGALNGALVAHDPCVASVDQLERVWLDIDGDALFPGLGNLWALARRGPSVHGDRGLRRLLEHLPFERLEDARVPLHVVATSLETGRERWFHEGPAATAILASAAIPGIFPPVELDGDLLVDGGVVDNVPISRAVTLGADRVYVLHVGNFPRRRIPIRRPLDVLWQAFSIARNHRFATESASPPVGVEIITLPAVDPGPIRRNDFSHTTELMARGYEAAAAFLDGPEVRAAAG